MVSAANIWLAGILNCLVSSYHTQERFSSFKTCFTTTSDFWILSSYSLILWKKLFVFPRRVTLGTRIFICSNYYSLKFRMCVGSKIPISHSHKQMMPRLLPRAAAAGKQNWNVNEYPEVTASRRVFFPGPTVHQVAVQWGGHLLAGED